MRLPWNEIRARAAEFSRGWAEAAYEKGETQSFYNDSSGVGVRARWRPLEERVKRLDNSDGYIDLLGYLLVELERGRSLGRARAGG